MSAHLFAYSPSQGLPETPLRKEMERDIVAVFDRFDEKQKRFLSKFEFKLAFMALMGYVPSKVCCFIDE
jgi:hypothetical protein